MARLLPPWMFPDSRYDFSSTQTDTLMEETARLYQCINDIVEAYDKLMVDVKALIKEYQDNGNKTLDDFKEEITKLCHDFIVEVDRKIEYQNDLIDENLAKNKELLDNKTAESLANIQALFDELVATFETMSARFMEEYTAISDKIDDFEAMFTDNVNQIVVKLINELAIDGVALGLTYDASNEALTVKESTGGIEVTNGLEITSYTDTGYPATGIYHGTSIPAAAFYSSSSYGVPYLRDISLTLDENITTIGKYCFYGCTNLTINKLPDALTKIDANAFQYCTNLVIDTIPAINNLGNECFRGCKNITKLTWLATTPTPISSEFRDTGLTTLILPNATSVSSFSSTAFTNTPIASGTGAIYVPDNMVDSFKTGNWSSLADYIHPISEYTE